MNDFYLYGTGRYLQQWGATQSNAQMPGGVMSSQQKWPELPSWVTTGYVPPREMTAADLGLPDSRAAILAYMMATNAIYRRMVMGDAPYAFWLGAEG
jgi:hypothetical protein